MLWLKEYDRHARLIPGLLAIFPVVAVAVAFGIHELPTVSVLTGLVASFGGAVLLADWVRDRGLTIQEELLEQWDGLPTTRRLRWRSPDAGSPLWEHRRTILAAATGIELPSEKVEAEAPAAADTTYTGALDVARELVRDKGRFPLVFEENKGYGFHRNLLGIRPVGFRISAVSALIAVLVVGLDSAYGVIGLSIPQMLASVVVPILGLGFWTEYSTASSVQRAAERYADRFFAALQAQNTAEMGYGGRQS